MTECSSIKPYDFQNDFENAWTDFFKSTTNIFTLSLIYE